jgi:EmrB/QacA subfamily drug resistance transporter
VLRTDEMQLRTDALAASTGVSVSSTTIAYVVGGALFLSMLDASMVAAALPAMSLALHVDPLSMSVVITAYLLTTIIMVPASAWLADRFGTRRMFLTGIVVFTLSSLVCGLVSSLMPLVAVRLVQGAGAALMVTVGRILLLRSTPKLEYVKALSYLAVPALIAPVIGPPLGGFLVVHGSWRYVFLVNVPVGMLALFAALILIKSGHGAQRKPFDASGFLLIATALACLVFGLESATAKASAMVTAGLLSVGTLSALVYVLHARRREYPILDLKLFRTPTFFIAVVGGTVCRFSLGAMPLLLMLLLQIGFGMDALAAGAIVLATAVGSIAVKFVVAATVNRFGFRPALLVSGVLCGALTISCTAFQATTPPLLIAFLLSSIGFVRSLHLTVANTLSYADVPEQDIGAATSVATTAQYVAMAAGVGLAVLIMRISTTLHGSMQLSESDIDAAIIVMGVIYIASTLLFRKLDPDAGAKLRSIRRSTE